MDIQLSPKLKIGSDEHNYIIYCPYDNKKTGEKVWKAKYFFPTLEALVHDLVETEIRALDAKTLSELVKGAEAIKKRLGELLEPHRER